MAKKQKAVWISQTTDFSAFEMDELYWFLSKKERTDSKANIFIMTMLSRKPRQRVAFAVDTSVNSAKIQKLGDSVPAAKLTTLTDVSFIKMSYTEAIT